MNIYLFPLCLSNWAVISNAVALSTKSLQWISTPVTLQDLITYLHLPYIFQIRMDLHSNWNFVQIVRILKTCSEGTGPITTHRLDEHISYSNLL